MGKRAPILGEWLTTLGAMIDAKAVISVSCTMCGRSRKFTQADLIALADKVGREYTLINRRCRCRLTVGCAGWNRFHYLNGVVYPLWNERGLARWWDS